MSIKSVLEGKIEFWEINPEGYLGTRRYQQIKEYECGITFNLLNSDKEAKKSLTQLLGHIKLISRQAVEIKRPSIYDDDNGVKYYERAIWFKSYDDRTYAEKRMLEMLHGE